MYTLQNVHNLTGRILNLPLQCTHQHCCLSSLRQALTEGGNVRSSIRLMFLVSPCGSSTLNSSLSHTEILYFSKNFHVLSQKICADAAPIPSECFSQSVLICNL